MGKIILKRVAGLRAHNHRATAAAFGILPAISSFVGSSVFHATDPKEGSQLPIIATIAFFMPDARNNQSNKHQICMM